MEADRPHSGWEPTRLPVYAVIRFDPARKGFEHQVMVWEVLSDIAEAEAEVEHLNDQVPPGRDTVYFIAASCYYPEGRHAPRPAWGSRREDAPPRRPVGPPAPRDRLEGEWGFLVEAVDRSADDESR